MFVHKVQIGAAGSHSDDSVHVRLTGPDRVNPMSHVYVAVAFKVLFPTKPEVKYIDPFSVGKRGPHSVGTKQRTCFKQFVKCSKYNTKQLC